MGSLETEVRAHSLYDSPEKWIVDVFNIDHDIKSSDCPSTYLTQLKHCETPDTSLVGH